MHHNPPTEPFKQATVPTRTNQSSLLRRDDFAEIVLAEEEAKSLERT
jgi:hypothetical protein